MRTSLKQLLTLYVFTWTQTLTLTRMLKAQIEKLNIQDPRLDSLIANTEHQADQLRRTQQNHDQAAQIKIFDQQMKLKTIFFNVYKILTSMHEPLSEQDPLFPIMSAWLDQLFNADQRRMARASAHDLLTTVKIALDTMNPDEVAQMGAAFVRVHAALHEAHTELLAASQMQAQLIKQQQDASSLSLRDARRAQRDAMHCLVGYIAGVYFDPQQEGGAVFEALAGTVEQINQVARASRAR
ncbi:hypothetical protein KKB55_21695 [Myxococcota bacterium]|nr:hypothetical protein [Myxococcota bacterium]MBU1900365.1 hypothetical protein [Myxococcota bacterium]